MYQRQLNGYAAMGYKAKGEEIETTSLDIIFNRDNFLPAFSNDAVSAKKNHNYQPLCQEKKNFTDDTIS